MSANSEQKLLTGLRNRDRTAMKELYGLYSGYLNGICSRYIADRDAAKDVLQDSFVNIFSSIDNFRFRGEGSLKAWMRKIVVNQALKYLEGNPEENIPKLMAWVDRLMPKRILLDHFDDAFPPASREEDTRPFYRLLSSRYPQIRAVKPKAGKPVWL